MNRMRAVSCERKKTTYKREIKTQKGSKFIYKQ